MRGSLFKIAFRVLVREFELIENSQWFAWVLVENWVKIHKKSIIVVILQVNRENKKSSKKSSKKLHKKNGKKFTICIKETPKNLPQKIIPKIDTKNTSKTPKFNA